MCNGDIATGDVLLRYGANVDIGSTHSGPSQDWKDIQEMMPLMVAALRRLNDALCFLLDRNANVSLTNGSFGSSALVFAARRGSSACVKSLLKRGAAFDAQDSTGDTAVHFAAAEGHVECLQMLRCFGAHMDFEKQSRE